MHRPSPVQALRPMVDLVIIPSATPLRDLGGLRPARVPSRLSELWSGG